MPAFWKPPVGIWTIDITFEDVYGGGSQVTIKCNGEAVSWGGTDYLDDLVTTFRRYQWAAGKPDCERCGHDFLDHLENHNCELMVYDPGTPTRHGRSACNWGGGHEGSCGCKGYISKWTLEQLEQERNDLWKDIKKCLAQTDVKKPPIWSRLKACLKQRHTSQ